MNILEIVDICLLIDVLIASFMSQKIKYNNIIYSLKTIQKSLKFEIGHIEMIFKPCIK